MLRTISATLLRQSRVLAQEAPAAAAGACGSSWGGLPGLATAGRAAYSSEAGET